MWNHFDNNHDRTNNCVEGANSKIKSFCEATLPIQQYESTARDKYFNAKKENAHKSRENNSHFLRNEKFKLFQKIYMEGIISFNDYVISLICIISLQR